MKPILNQLEEERSGFLTAKGWWEWGKGRGGLISAFTVPFPRISQEQYMLQQRRRSTHSPARS